MSFPYSVQIIEVSHPEIIAAYEMVYHEDVRDERLFAFPNSTLVFDYGGIQIKHNNTIIEPPRIFFHPPKTTFIQYSKKKNTTMLVFMLQPSTYHKMTENSLKKIKIDDHYLSGNEHFSDLYKEYFNNKNIKECTKLLIETIDHQFQLQREQVDQFIDLIIAKKGKISVNEVVRQSGFSIFKLNRLFKETLGMKMKDFINIVQFTEFIEAIKLPVTSIEDFHETFNYHSYKDLEKKLIKYTGLSISEFPNKTLHMLHKHIISKNNKTI